MQTEIFIKETELMERLTALVNTFMQTGQSILVNEKTINIMAKGLKVGLMGQNTKDSTLMAKNTEMEPLTEVTEASMKASLWITQFMALEYTNGMMEESMSENEKAIKWTAKESLFEVMEEAIEETISMTKNMDLEFFSGRISENMKETGLMANSMAKEFILPLTAE